MVCTCQVARIVRSASLAGAEINAEVEETTAWTVTLTIPNALIAEVAASHSPRLPAPGVVRPFVGKVARPLHT